MNKPVSVITISYNSAQCIRAAIESVLAQSYSNFEYIISDDCSTDNTWDIIQEYNDPRIRRFQNDRNIGEYPNRNKTLDLACGEYVIWIDGDDIFYPHGLEFMVKMLDAFPESAMACARPYWPNMVYPYELTPRETYLFDFFGSPVTVNGFPDTLFKTSILKDAGNLPDEYVSGDSYIKRKIAAQHKILLISNGISWWRKTSGQASAKIRGSAKGACEDLIINKKLLSDPACPLSKKEGELALKNLIIGFSKKILRLELFKFRLPSFFKCQKFSKIPIWKVFYYFFLKQDLSHLRKANPEAPLCLDFKKNPYSKLIDG
jgi:glycosyltransferase involved in cell wall biosynthesis